MKKIKKTQVAALALSCVLVCGAWSAPIAATAQDARYVGGELISMYSDEIIEYSTKQEVADMHTPANVPFYYNNNNSLTNYCGAVAGAIAAGYYDRYYSEMISGWDSFVYNAIYTLQDNVHVPATINSLYSLMKTNVVAEGVSKAEFKSGLTEYAKKQGYTLGYSSLGTGNGFDYSSYKSAINKNKVSVLFVSPSNLYTISVQTGKDTVSTVAVTGKHIMIAYGYYEIKYTFSGGSSRTDKYLLVATGFNTTKRGFYKVSSQLDDAYVIEVS